MQIQAFTAVNLQPLAPYTLLIAPDQSQRTNKHFKPSIWNK